MLCGVCLANSQVNNIIYGLAATMAGLDWDTIVVGADLHNRFLNPNAVPEGPTQWGSYGVGMSLVQWVNDVSRGTDVAGMCAYITSDPNFPKAWGRATEEGKYKDCQPCDEPAMPGVDFSKLNWN